MAIFTSDISKKDFPISDKISGNVIKQPILNSIQEENPDFTREQYLSISELNYFREKYIANSLIHEIGELTEMDQTVIDSLSDRTTILTKIESEEKTSITYGQKVADQVATFGGSWTFILSFGAFIVLWIALNILIFLNKGFDPYPFILLNLILSCLAALQAPVIMMSQNRQEEKDRDRAKKDYMINLKSELEIRMLHEKIDHLIMHQQQELLEIQKVQIEMITDILKQIKPDN